MISLSDHQLELIMRTAAPLSEEECQEFLERVAAAAAVDLEMHGQINDGDVALAVQLALRGLTHNLAVSQNGNRNWLPTRAWRLPAWSAKPRNWFFADVLAWGKDKLLFPMMPALDRLNTMLGAARQILLSSHGN